MKVCVLSFTGLDTDGKDATRILKEMKSLVNAGHEVKALGLRLREALPQNESWYGVEIHRVKPVFGFDRNLQGEVPSRNPLAIARKLYVLIVKNTFGSGLALFRVARKENANVYHCFGIYSLIPGFFLKIFKRKVVVIYDAYEVPNMLIGNMTSFGFVARPLATIVGFSELFMSRIIDCVLTIPSKNNLFENRFKKHNKHVVPLNNVPLIDWIHIQDSKSELNDEESKYIIYMGALSRAKGIVRIIESFDLVHKVLPESKLVLIGGFGARSSDNPEKEVMGYIKEHGLESSVIITGHVDWKQVPRYLNNANVALHVYQPMMEHFHITYGSSSFYEYMAATLPIVSSDFLGTSPIIERFNCGILVNPLDEEAIANAIISLLDDPVRAREMGESGRKAFEQVYNWYVEEKKLLEAYSGFENN